MALLKTASPGNPVVEKIKAKRNDTFSYKLVGYNADNTPYDFTGHTFKMQIRFSSNDETPVIDITNASFTITQNSAGATAGVNNVVLIQHAKEDFNVTSTKYLYDVEMTDAAGVVQTIMEGIFEVTDDITR